MMKKRTQIKIAIALMILLILVLPVFSSNNKPILTTDLNNYEIGDRIIINSKIDLENKTLIIKSDEARYILIGNFGNKTYFITEKSGKYTVELRDPNLNNLIDSINFNVKKPIILNNDISVISAIKEYMFIDKKFYFLGEKVTINTTDELENKTLEIKYKNQTYLYKDFTENVVFNPIKAGLYSVEFKSNGEVIASLHFEVKDALEGIVPYKIINFHVPSTGGIKGKIKSKLAHVKNSKNKSLKIKIKTEKQVFENYDKSDIELDKFYEELTIETEEVKEIKIRFNKVNISKGLNINLQRIDVKKIDESRFNKKSILSSFSIQNLNKYYVNATFEFTASGTELYECSEFNFLNQTCNGNWIKIMNLIHGNLYSIDLRNTTTAYIETGVATINTKLPIYHPGEVAKIIMVVLDRKGFLVSNAYVSLTIIDPLNNINIYSTKDLIRETKKGIYELDFLNTNSIGNYTMIVSAETENVNYSMSSEFYVKNFYEFDIIRNTPVTIDPWQGPFKSIISFSSYIGNISFNYTESLPSNFTVYDTGGAKVRNQSGRILLTWNNISQDDRVSYSANSPLVTPNLYILGKSIIEYNIGGIINIFEEARKWFLAIDPIRNLFFEDFETGYTTCAASRPQIGEDCSLGYGLFNHCEDLAGDYLFCTTLNGQEGDHTSYSIEMVDWDIWNETAGLYYSFDPSIYDDINVNGYMSSASNDNNNEFCRIWVKDSDSWTTIYQCINKGANAVPAGCAAGDKTPESVDYVYFEANLSTLSGINLSETNISIHIGADQSGLADYCFWDKINITGIFYPPIVNLTYPSNSATMSSIPIEFNFTVYDSKDSVIPNCTIWSNFTETWSPGESIINITNNTENSFLLNVPDGSYAWNVRCTDSSNTSAFSATNYTLFIDASPPVKTVVTVSEDSSSPWSTIERLPEINISLNKNGDCKISPDDESYSNMANKTDCLGDGTNFITCYWAITLPIGFTTLYVSCNDTNNHEDNSTTNLDLTIDILCDSHLDCNSNEYCNYNQDCIPDVIEGYNCEDLAYGLGEDNEVCLTNYCTQDTWDFVGYFCGADADNCVYNDGGNSYDLNYALCSGNQYKLCEAGTIWSDFNNCSYQNDPYNQNATSSTHIGEYCSYLGADQSCFDGDLDLGSYGCIGGSPADCGSYVYLGSGVCGSSLSDCDVGCGAGCDLDNSTNETIVEGICYYDKSCSVVCDWSKNSEIIPDFCIGDSNGGVCSYNNRTNPSNIETCYYNSTCQNIIGASLDSNGILKQNYCDYCNGTGNQSGAYSPIPNASCTSNCANEGTIYYDSFGTPSNRTDDCNGYGITNILSDTLTSGDVWNGSAPAYCEDAECNIDCGSWTGVCNTGVCNCIDTDIPIINLIYPLNNSWSNNNLVNFYYNVLDYSSSIENCSLLINSIIVNTTINPEENTTLNFTRTLVDGAYNWSVLCYDNSTNSNYNETGKRFIGTDTVKPLINNANKAGNITFKISDYVCLNVTASDALSKISRVYALIKLPTGGTEEVNMYDNKITSCDESNGDGTYSVEYLIRYSGQFIWNVSFAVDKANNIQNTTSAFYWNVTEGGNLIVNITSPLSDIKINESEENNFYYQTCNASCDWGFVDCKGVSLNVEYHTDTSWQDVSNETTELTSNVSSYYCGKLIAYQAPWWNTTFLYRKQMRINTFDAIAADHVIRVDYNTTGSKFRDDGRDLRIVYWNGTHNNELDRQIFQPNTTGSSIWFVIGKALAANSTNFNYYLYYGNENSTNPKNNQSNIWLFYDDFSDGTYTDKWGYTAAAGEITVSTATNPWSNVSYVLDVGTSCGTTYTKVLTSQLSPIRDMASRILWMDNPGTTCGGGSPDADGVVGLQASATTTYDGILVERDTDTGFHYDTGAIGSLTGSQYYSIFNVWQWSEQRVYGTNPNDYMARYWLYNESEPTSYPLVATGFDPGYPTAGQPFVRVASGRAYIAVVMIRPTVQKEPVTEIKGEESVDATKNNTCQYTFKVTSGNNSGNNTWDVRCKAISTNSEFAYSKEINLTINDHPVAVINSPSNSSWISGIAIINVSSSFDSDGSITNYLYKLDNNTAFNSPTTLCNTADSNCTFDTTTPTQCKESIMECYLKLTVTENDGLTNSTITLFGIDNTGPITNLIRPVNFENITANDYLLNATVNDGGIGTVDYVTFEYRENNTATWKSACNDSDGSPFECLLDITLWNGGNSYEFRAYANDSKGNIGVADSHTNITIDRNGPVTILLSPTSYTNISSNFYKLNVTANDLYSFVDTISFEYRNNPTADWSLICINNSGTECSWDLTYLGDGNLYQVRARAKDSLANFGNYSVAENITVDRTGPVTTIQDPLTNADIGGTTYDVNSSAIDVYSFIDSVVFEYRINNTDNWKSACISKKGYNCSWNLITLNDGNDYQLRDYANDTLNNLGGYDTELSITIDNNGPQITLLSPEHQAVDGDGNILFEFNANDIASDISSCELLLNGLLNQTNNSIQEGVNKFELINLTNGNYDWSIRCTDNFINPNNYTSEQRNFTIDIKYMLFVNLTTDRNQYERGNQETELVNVTNYIYDFYGQPLIADLTIDLIKPNGTDGWWNTSWEKRKPIYLSTDYEVNRTNVTVLLSITGLNGNITDCVNEIRVASLTKEEKTVNVLGGDNSTYCDIAFQADLSANANNEKNYYVYYNNSFSTDPGYAKLSKTNYTLFFEDFEGANWTTITGEDPTTECAGGYGLNFNNCVNYLTSHDFAATTGGTPISETHMLVMDNAYTWAANEGIWFNFNALSACGGDACSEIEVSGYYAAGSVDNTNEFCRVWARNDTSRTFYTIASCTNGQVCEFSSGNNDMPPNIYNFTFFNQTLKEDLGMGLSSYTAVHIGGNVPGGSDQCFFDDISIIGYQYESVNITSKLIGDTQTWINQTTGQTNNKGYFSWVFSAIGFEEGFYSAVSYATKTQYENRWNHSLFEIVDDQTEPYVELVSPKNATEHNSSVTFTYRVNDTLSSILNCSLFIDNALDDINTFITEGPVQFFYPFIPQGGWHNWSVCCYDYYSNYGCSENRSIYIKPPDLEILSSNIKISKPSPLIGETITINATIFNRGGSSAYNIIAQFWDGNPSSEGIQIGDNFTFNLTDIEGTSPNITLNVSYDISRIGPTNLYVAVDPPTATNGSVFELREYNNKNFTKINVPAWHITYGNITAREILSTVRNDTFISWNWTNVKGNIFVSETGVNIEWSKLQAIGRNITDGNSVNDFHEIDLALNMTTFNDSINITFTNYGIPKDVTNITVYFKNIRNIPIINSSVNENFITGILWDSSDGNFEFNGSQDIIFITKINQKKQGGYGIYDYEITHPVRLSEYNEGMYSTVDLFYEII